MIEWRENRGLNFVDNPMALPPGQVQLSQNVDLVAGTLGMRRRSTVAVSLTSGPAGPIYFLFEFVPSSGLSDQTLFAWSDNGGTPELDKRASGSWASVTLSDTVASFATNNPHAAVLNDKVFLAYNSDVNRLHVYDPEISTTTIRRVGLTKSNAPTVADTGSGAYAATLRYYKVQFGVVDSDDVRAISEVSASVDFTPSGSGTHARVTKPTSVDDATHWRVFGSADNITFYRISTWIVIATTTYDDDDTPSAYVSSTDGEIPQTAGTNIPPPSVKFLLSDGSRLVMAGAWETGAGSSAETVPKSSRVWFTRVLGASDLGDDESIPNTLDQQNWVDVGEKDGDAITALGGPLEGIIYVFKRRSIWRLTPTGIGDRPYTRDLVTNRTGAVSQYAVAQGEDGSGNPCLYFQSNHTIERISASGSVQEVGDDLIRTSLASAGVTADRNDLTDNSWMIWETSRRKLYVGQRGQVDGIFYVFDPSFEQPSGESFQGGWSQFKNVKISTTNFFPAIYTAVTLDSASGDVIYLGGDDGGEPPAGSGLATLSGTDFRDLATGSGFEVLVTGPIHLLFGGLAFGRPRAPLIFFDAANAEGVYRRPALQWDSKVQGLGQLAEDGLTVGPTAVPAHTYDNGGILASIIEGMDQGDLLALQQTVYWDSDTASQAGRDIIYAVLTPIDQQQRVTP
jgi:hypothetical protein